MNFAKGYLTYTLAVVAILYGALSWLVGGASGMEAMGPIYTGFTIIGLRRAIN